MDSVTQFTLGACVGVAVLGRKIGPMRAALSGGILGTLPDMDVFFVSDDPIESFVQHRSWSHSILVQALLTPVFGEAVGHIFKSLKPDRGLAWAAVFLCLATHSLLDATTIYGTQLLWPIWPEPFFLGSVFIIDPVYTLPLLVATLWALFVPRWKPSYGKVLVIALGLSSAYLAWTITAQQFVAAKARAMLAKHNIGPDQLIATPTPFNSYYWLAIGLDGDRTFNLYIPVFGGADDGNFYAYNRNLTLAACLGGDRRIENVARFSHGNYRMMIQDGEVSIADLRMGLPPNYAFRFVLGRLENGNFVPSPTRRLEGRGDIATDLDWLSANLKGQVSVRPAEADAKISFERYKSAGILPPFATGC
jgi:inner membrane protein